MLLPHKKDERKESPAIVKMAVSSGIQHVQPVGETMNESDIYISEVSASSDSREVLIAKSSASIDTVQEASLIEKQVADNDHIEEVKVSIELDEDFV